MTDKEQKNIALPPLKPGITISFSQYDKQGKPQWVIHDTGRNKFFIIGWLEHEIITRWDLKNPELIIDAINAETTMEVEPTDIEKVLEYLKNNYLIQQSGYQISKIAKDQNLFKSDNIVHWLTSHYLFFKIPVWKCDPFLTKTKWVANWIFSRNLLYLMILLAVIGGYNILINWDDFIHSFPDLISWQGLFFYFIAFTITKLIHELGHAYMCKRFGVPVPTLGIAFLVFWPVLYTDTTLSWYLESKQRLRISFAGIWMETYVVIIAAILWGISGSSIIQTICFITITVNWVASLLINASPFMRFDGYFILSDYLQMPNLQPRAFALTRWQIRRWLFDWPDPPPEKFPKGLHRFLVAYSIFTWLYRLTLYLGIALLVYHYFFKVLGLTLFLVEIYYFILGPIIFELKFWIASKEKFHFNKKSIITLIVCGILILFFVLPVQNTIEIPSTVSYKHQFLYAPANGVLITPIPLVNTSYKKDQVILKISSPELLNSLQIAALEYQKTIGELRRAAIDRKFVSEKNILLSNLNEDQAEYSRLQEMREKLTIKAPFDGVISDAAEDIKVGTIVHKDTWLGDLVDLRSIQIEAFVPQIDLKYIHKNSRGYFYSENISISKIPVKVIAIEALNVQQLVCSYARKTKKQPEEDVAIETPCYHSSDLGGQIQTYLSDKGEFVPSTSYYRLILIPEEKVSIPYLLRGVIKVNTKGSSYAERFIYWTKKILVQEADA